ncbi:hypothetical protein H4R26_004824 [Coemansia thaxteri]|uniref:Ubiquilin n=1 Tax=Coemansia thaxteri TaxID=2663907 RepID=A0A9W8EH70_9FUNG|nr:hypothetical protein H4R26_004824 [Coemansia thaxteri]
MDDDSASNSQCDSAGGLPEFTLRVRQTNGTIIEHSVASRALSVASLKQALSERTEIPVERMRLMLESTILADDNSLESYGKYNIHDGSVLRLVQLAGNHVQSHPQNVNGITSAPPAPPSSAQAMTNQARQLFLANPQLAQTFMMANPQMREALENNPELRRLMSDPEVMQQSFNAVQNPRLLQEVQRNNDRVLSNLESAPGGYAHIRRMYHSVQEPLARAAADDSMRMPLDELNRRRARMLGVVKPDPSRVNTTPLPNPWSSARPRAGSRSSAFDSRNPFAMMDQVSRNADRLARLNISAASPPPPQPRASARQSAPPVSRDPLGLSQLQSQLISHLQERFRDELDQLEEMGFGDKEKNLRALVVTDGDLSQALSIIADCEDD